jgi:hypothetical protein
MLAFVAANEVLAVSDSTNAATAPMHARARKPAGDRYIADAVPSHREEAEDGGMADAESRNLKGMTGSLSS